MGRDLFAVLAEPARRALLDELVAGERSVGELVAATGAAQPSVSKHLGVLADAGLVRVRAEGARRIYALDPTPLGAVDRWLAPYRAAADRRLEVLERRLDAVAAAEGVPGGHETRRDARRPTDVMRRGRSRRRDA
ncbi:ArsR/SmtB family transcription factor [Nocardioides zeae]|uniref:Winged helix-turn-helix transcriptional regulator n=1 Tax=Nocardioides zeae TaxID=1457234 RepID=A0A6P0HIH1_9ACTN|nr:metalloregulator ArsR/SmtB family transcription factor [Nocardioides zeae]NEN78401.1 winged helix-turn-helix transcriptional regulator [Nocardioides zeae]